MTDRDFSISIIHRLRIAGFVAYWAGGCVRDHLLGITPHDYDVATSAEPREIQPLFRHTLEIGAAFGVIQVVGPRQSDGSHLSCEVATFRTDGQYTDGRRPDSVRYCTPQEDAQRRDFTINGMFFDPIAGELIDYVGGQIDLENRLLRAIGNPLERFTEDKLRLLRGVRMATRFSLTIDPDTVTAIQQMASQITIVSAERIADEFRKLFVHPRRAMGIRWLCEFGLLTAILPELATERTDAEHWQMRLRSLESLPSRSGFPLVLAMLLNGLTPKIVKAITTRLKLANDERDRILWLVTNQRALMDLSNTPLHVLKPLLVHPGIDDLLAMTHAQATARGELADGAIIAQTMLRTIPREQLDPPVLITGDDLTARGMKPGPLFKRLLDAVRNAQLDEQIHRVDEANRLIDALIAE